MQTLALLPSSFLQAVGSFSCQQMDNWRGIIFSSGHHKNPKPGKEENSAESNAKSCQISELQLARLGKGKAVSIIFSSPQNLVSITPSIDWQQLLLNSWSRANRDCRLQFCQVSATRRHCWKLINSNLFNVNCWKFQIYHIQICLNFSTPASLKYVFLGRNF